MLINLPQQEDFCARAKDGGSSRDAAERDRRNPGHTGLALSNAAAPVSGARSDAPFRNPRPWGSRYAANGLGLSRRTSEHRVSSQRAGLRKRA